MSQFFYNIRTTLSAIESDCCIDSTKLGETSLNKSIASSLTEDVID